MRRCRVVPWLLLSAAMLLTQGCSDARQPSATDLRPAGPPIQLTITASPTEGIGVRMAAPDTAYYLCRYTLTATVTGEPFADVEWLGTVFVDHNVPSGYTPGRTAEETTRFWSTGSTTTYASSAWSGLGGITPQLSPRTLQEVFYFRRKGEAGRDSASYSFVCRVPPAS